MDLAAHVSIHVPAPVSAETYGTEDLIRITFWQRWKFNSPSIEKETEAQAEGGKAAWSSVVKSKELGVRERNPR